MKASLTINSFELGDYIVEDGIKITNEVRSSKSIITADGQKWYQAITKKTIEVTLSDLFDDVYTSLCAHFSPNPAAVTFSDFETGQTYSGTFYVSELSQGVKKSISTITYLDDLSLRLEEK